MATAGIVLSIIGLALTAITSLHVACVGALSVLLRFAKISVTAHAGADIFYMRIYSVT